MGYITRVLLRGVYFILIWIGIAEQGDLNVILNDPDLIMWTNTALGVFVMLLTEGWYLMRDRVYKTFKKWFS